MKKRLRKKREKQARELCQLIRGDFCEGDLENRRTVAEISARWQNGDMDKPNHTMHELERIVRRCLAERFPIQNYVLCDINGTEDGAFYDFALEKDMFKLRKTSTGEVRAISFLVDTQSVTPFYLVGSCLIPARSCRKAVYIEAG